MPNACFRCKTPIESGGTFCGDCRTEVSLAALDRTQESRLWLVLVAFLLWLPVGGAISALAGLVGGAASLLVGSLVGLVGTVLAFAFLVALVWDAKHVRERDDVDWKPSQVGYWMLAAGTLFCLFLPAPFVAAYHLYRRKQAVGLPVRRY